MKTNYRILSVILVMLFTVAVWGQSANKNLRSKPVKKINDISNLLGKPVYESTVDSLNTKVWIITQKTNKSIKKTTVGAVMGKMKDKDAVKDAEVKEAIATGTHYFIFDVTNILTKKEIADTSAKVAVVSPSKKMSSVYLQPMMNHFGGGITLNEKGEYLFTINLNVGAGYRTSQFKYKFR